MLLGSPVGASDFLGWLLKEETSPLFSGDGVDSPVPEVSPPPLPACPVLASLLLDTWKLSHPMVQGRLDFSLPGGPCGTASRCFLAPLGVGAPHPPPALRGVLGTAVLLLASFPGTGKTLRIFTCVGELSMENAGSERMSCLWSCTLLCCRAWCYPNLGQGRWSWLRTRWTASERAPGAENRVLLRMGTIRTLFNQAGVLLQLR